MIHYSKTHFRTSTRPSKNLTFDKDTADLLANISLDKEEDWKNQTFTRKRLSRDSSEGFDDDRGSVNSDNSTGHRLNDVGDVQTLARLQEESKIFWILYNFEPPYCMNCEISRPVVQCTYIMKFEGRHLVILNCLAPKINFTLSVSRPARKLLMTGSFEC